MKPIFLLGFMCSGKSTLGKALARKTGMRFIDLDDMVEAEAGMDIPHIFAEKGEAEFRRLEAEALERVARSTDIIIACGGGTPCRPGAMDIMNSAGLTVRLLPERSVLLRRLLDGRAGRPLIAAISTAEEMNDFVETTSSRREPYYSLAQAVFDTSELESDEQVEATARRFIMQFIEN